MTEVKDVLGLVFSAITVITALIGGIYYLIRKIAQIEFKVNTLWDFIMRRAISEAVTKNLGSFNSPLTFSDSVVELVRPLLPQIRSRIKNIDKLSDRQLFIQIESNFGDTFLKDICIPNKLDKGSCLLVALHLLGREINEGVSK